VLHIATSSGGHIDLLVALGSAFEGYRRIWVAQPSIRARRLKAQGEDVFVMPDYDRHPIRGHFLQNIWHSARLVLSQRPKVIVTSGAGVTVPFCLLARLTGAKIIFVETMARVTGPSASGKVLSRLATRVLVQWPEAAAFYRRAVVCHPTLLESVTSDIATTGRGVFVGVGTHNQPFDRILEVVDRAVGAGVLSPPVVAQGGVSEYRPKHFEMRDWLEPHEVEQAIGEAEYVICHAGSGIVSSALRAGRRPLVLARRARHGEHFDDHQTQIVTKLEHLGLVVGLGDEIREADLEASRAPMPSVDQLTVGPPVEAALRDELQQLLQREPASHTYERNA
jgi:UDP-N-acetylglucosamine transferase subunit ALG13